VELLDFEEVIDETTIIPNDPLRQRKNVYPLLAVSWLDECASAERLFSTAGLTLSDKRNSLSGDSVTTLVWLRQERRELGISPLNDCSK
jgi:hypothetical protein